MLTSQPLISHEIPKALFPLHHWINSYPYLLAHLMYPTSPYYDKEYADFYKGIVKEYEYSILDNSAFELGDSINMDDLYNVGEEYKPSHIIIPDKFHDMAATMERCMQYVAKYGNISTPKLIGVLQGKDINELSNLIRFYNSIPQIDIIALPYDLLPRESCPNLSDYEYKLIRVDFVQNLATSFPNGKKLHLLGCATPNEFSYYNHEDRKLIKSIDTSAPIIYGWNNIRFSPIKGLDANVEKPKEKLAESLDIKLDVQQLQDIAHNVRQFKTNLYNL